MILSSERRRALAGELLRLGLTADMPALLATLGPTLAGYGGWQDDPAQLSRNVQQLLVFAEARACVDALEAAVQIAQRPAAPVVAPPPVSAAELARQVDVTQALKDDLIKAIRAFGTDQDGLRQSASSAFGNLDVIDRVAWQKSIVEVAGNLVNEATVEGTLWQLVEGLYRQRPNNAAFARFVRTYFAMFYRDPVESRTAVKWAVNGSIFDALVVARRSPMIDRGPVRQVLLGLFQDPDNAPTVLTIDGPSRSGKSYLSSLVELLVDSGSRGHPQTAPHTAGQYRYALLRPVQRGRVLTVGDAAGELFSQLGWKAALPKQTKSDDGWAQEVIFELRDRLAQGDDIVWIVADRFWGFPQDVPVIDFILGLAREATLMSGRRKLRLVLIDFPREPLDRFVDDNGAAAAQFEHLRIDWLTAADVESYCDAFAGAVGLAEPAQAKALYRRIEQQVDTARLAGAELQRAWCMALKNELVPYW